MTKRGREDILKTFFFSCLILTFFISSRISFSYHVKNAAIVDEENHVIQIDGVNWSGFQDSGLVDELYGEIPLFPHKSIPIGLIDMLIHPENFPALTNVNAQQSVSFRTIRLPIQPYNLRDNLPNNKFRKDLTDAKNPTDGNGVFCKSWNMQSQYCETSLSISESLYQLLQIFKDNNINVLIDFHQTPQGRNGNVITTNYTLKNYYDDVVLLANKIKTKKLTNVIGIDVFNEPHNLNWFTEAGGQPAWITVIAIAAKAIYQTNPDLLVFVEGANSEESGPLICLPRAGLPEDAAAYSINLNECGEGLDGIHFKSNWGENFRPLLDPDAAKQSHFKLGHALREQLSRLLDDKIINWLLGQADDASRNGAHLVFSPHVYGEHVASWQSSPSSSPYRFDWNFGFLQKAGYPLVIGETGFKLSANQDVNFFSQSLVPYLKKNKLNHFLFYWTFNSNSSDTDGIRMNDRTAALVTQKESMLHDLFND